MRFLQRGAIVAVVTFFVVACQTQAPLFRRCLYSMRWATPSSRPITAGRTVFARSSRMADVLNQHLDFLVSKVAQMIQDKG